VITLDRKLAVAFFLLAVLGFVLAGQALAQTTSGVPGVSPGDYLVYSITTTWSTTNESLAIPQELLVDNSTLHYNVTVEAVQGTNVTIENNWVFTNGTDVNAPSLSNVDSGILYSYIPDRPAFQGIYDANLPVNSYQYPSGNDSGAVISLTITRNYASGKRDTNVVTYNYPVSDYNNNSGTESTTFYIDKTTGVLVERQDHIQFPTYTASITWTLKNTNLWTVSAAPLPLPLPLIIAIVVIIVAVVAVVAFYRERKKGGKKNRH
jgi:hypothetical protein